MTPPAKFFPFVENPATVMLLPISFSESIRWWSFDDYLLGGLQVNGHTKASENKPNHSRIGYLPTCIPRSWAGKSFNVTVEYEAEKPDSAFRLRLYYGCGDPSELHVGETDVMQGKAGKKDRIRFELNSDYITRNELFRATLEVIRESLDPVLIYGAWLEVGI